MFPALKWPLTAACEWRFATTWLIQFYASTSTCRGGTMGKGGWRHTKETKARMSAAQRIAKANAPRGPAHACWKGGTRTNQGRMFDYMDLGKRSNNYVQRARRIAEQMLGRPLRTDEHVHHKNGDTMDDRPENLEVLSSSEHSRRHATTRQHDPVTGRWLPKMPREAAQDALGPPLSHERRSGKGSGRGQPRPA